MEASVDRFTPEAFLVHEDWVRRLAQALLRNESDVDDIVQETWVAACQAKPSEIRNLRGWLARVVRNQSLKTVRKRQTESLADREITDGAPSVADVLQSEAQRTRIVELTISLDKPFFDVIALHTFEELSYSKVAERLGIPEITARTRYRRAINKLRAKCEREKIDGVPLAAFLPALAGRSSRLAPLGARAARPWFPITAAVTLSLLGAGSLIWWLNSSEPTGSRTVAGAVAAAEPGTPATSSNERAAPSVAQREVPVSVEPLEATAAPEAPLPQRAYIDLHGTLEIGESHGGGLRADTSYPLLAFVYDDTTHAGEPERLQARTKPDGTWSLPAPLPDGGVGSIVFGADGEDFEISRFPQDPVVITERDREVRDIALRAHPLDRAVSGVVLGEHARPVEGALVTCGSAQTTTDSDGRYSLLASSTWSAPRLRAEHPDYLSESLQIETSTPREVDLNLKRGAEGWGSVTDSAGQPLVGATAQVQPGQRSTRTNAQGQFRLNILEHGTQKAWLRISSAGMVTLEKRNLDLETLRSEPVVLTPGIELHVQVDGHDGAPAVGARVRVKSLSARGDWSARTDRSGRAALIEGLVPGTYEVIAERRGYAPSIATVTLREGDADQEARILLPAAHEFLGRVDRSLEPEAPYSIGVGWKGWWLKEAEYNYGPNGEFELRGLPLDALELSFSMEGYPRLPWEIEAEELDRAVPGIPVQLQGGAILSGVVTDPGGAFVTDAKVEVWLSKPPKRFVSVAAQSRYSEVTDAQGAFRIDGIPPGARYVVARHPEWKVRVLDDPLELAHGDNAELRLRFRESKR